MGQLSCAESGAQTYVNRAVGPGQQVAGHQPPVLKNFLGRAVAGGNVGFVDKRRGVQQPAMPPRAAQQAQASRPPAVDLHARRALPGSDVAGAGVSGNSAAASATHQNNTVMSGALTTAEKLNMLGIPVLSVKEGCEVQISYQGKAVTIKKGESNTSVSVNLPEQESGKLCTELERNGLTFLALVNDLKANDVTQKASGGWLAGLILRFF